MDDVFVLGVLTDVVVRLDRLDCGLFCKMEFKFEEFGDELPVLLNDGLIVERRADGTCELDADVLSCCEFGCMINSCWAAADIALFAEFTGRLVVDCVTFAVVEFRPAELRAATTEIHCCGMRMF